MGKRSKFGSNHEGLARLFENVGPNNWATYSTAVIPCGVFPKRLEEKVVSYTVATSGLSEEGRLWCVIIPHRVDKVGDRVSNRFQYDNDPFITFMDRSGRLAESGLYTYHSKHP